MKVLKLPVPSSLLSRINNAHLSKNEVEYERLMALFRVCTKSNK